MLSQARQVPPFPIENPNLGAGRAPLIMNLPVAYYTTFFRPQLWGFFLFDFERGFSFYWCCKVFGLLLATRLVPACQSVCAAVHSSSLARCGSFCRVSHNGGFLRRRCCRKSSRSWAVCVGCAVEMLRPSTRWRTAAALAGFVFFAINFVLCLYPPYQIPLLLLGAAILFGVWRETNAPARLILARHGFGILLVLLILVPFWIDVRPTLALVGQTVYPGARRSLGGDLSLFKLFSGLIGFFEVEQMGPGIYKNIAEASNFYPLWPLAALVVGFAAIRRRARIDPLLGAVGAN